MRTRILTAVLFVVAIAMHFCYGSNGEWIETDGGETITRVKFVNGYWAEFQVVRKHDRKLLCREWVDSSGTLRKEEFTL